MQCKWDMLGSVNPSLISMADVLTSCSCDRCKREREKSEENAKLREANARLKKQNARLKLK